MCEMNIPQVITQKLHRTLQPLQRLLQFCLGLRFGGKGVYVRSYLGDAIVNIEIRSPPKRSPKKTTADLLFKQGLVGGAVFWWPGPCPAG